jgi:NTE family protein
MNFLPSIFSFLIFLMTFPPLLPAQEDKPVETGLVLSGGGALGLAHIGVLQYLEEINFPIDRIGGTSMGGIVGGLYSLGYSADELADIVVLQDWDLLLSNYYDRQMASLEAREKQDRFLISLKREKDKISLGSALINGINIYLLLKELTYPFSPDQNFEDFPIPFYCISVDLANRKPIILDQGELAEALLATMAIPGVFAPVERETNYWWMADYSTTTRSRKCGKEGQAGFWGYALIMVKPTAWKVIFFQFSIVRTMF